MAEAKSKRPTYIDVDGFRLPGAFYPQAHRDTVNLKPSDGDIILSTFPKCGTTWVTQIVLQIFNKGAPDCNVQDLLKGCLSLDLMGTDGLEFMPSPRFYKTHLPFQLMPYSDKAKYIYVMRNPKDCLVSYYHHTCSNMYDFAGGDFDVYFDIFLNGENDFGDYFDHALTWYDHHNDSNVLPLYFESLKKDLRGSIKQIAAFLGPEYEETVNDESTLDRIVTHSSFEYMKKVFNEDWAVFTSQSEIDALPMPAALKHALKFAQAVEEKNPKAEGKMNGMRKGIVGDWRNVFSEEQNRRMDEKIERKLKGTDMLNFWRENKCLD